MISVRSLLFAVLLFCSMASPCLALDPMHTDIVAFRLGMTRTEALDHLAVQGYAPIEEGDSIQARTKDGVLRIDFSPDRRIRRVAYTFRGQGPNEVAILRDAMIEHYGKPTTDRPLTWCRVPLPSQACSPDRPLLTYGPGADGKGVLTLSVRAEN
jgi:hypothetical protein